MTKNQTLRIAATLLLCIVFLVAQIECFADDSAVPTLDESMQAYKDGQFREYAAKKPNVLKMKFDFSTDGKHKGTLLHFGAMSTNEEFVKLLLELGAAPATKDSDNFIPIVRAVLEQEGSDHEEIIRYLVANHPGNNPLESCFESLKNCLKPPVEIQNRLNMLAVTAGEETARVQIQQIYGERSKVIQKCMLTVKVATDGVDLEKYNVKNSKNKPSENQKKKEPQTSEKNESKKKASPVSDSDVNEDNLQRIEKEAENGNVPSQIAVGRYYLLKQDFTSAAKWFRYAAEKGDAEGQGMYGACFLMGAGVQKDDEQAFSWFEKAAAQGNASGQWRLGLCYANGWGVTKNIKKAIELYRKSAEQGNLDGMWNLAAHLDDQGKKEEAIKWYKTAAEQGKREAEWRFGDCYRTGIIVDGKTILAKDEKKAFEWFKKAAEHNSPEGLSRYAMCLLYGTGTEEDKKGCVAPFCKAAEMGEAIAQFMYGNILFIGEEFGVKQNHEKALEWIIKSAEQGHPPAVDTIKELQQMQQKLQNDQSRAEKYEKIKQMYAPRSQSELMAESNDAIMRGASERQEKFRERQREIDEYRRNKEQAESEGREYMGPFPY